MCGFNSKCVQNVPEHFGRPPVGLRVIPPRLPPTASHPMRDCNAVAAFLTAEPHGRGACSFERCGVGRRGTATQNNKSHGGIYLVKQQQDGGERGWPKAILLRVGERPGRGGRQKKNATTQMVRALGARFLFQWNGPVAVFSPIDPFKKLIPQRSVLS